MTALYVLVVVAIPVLVIGLPTWVLLRKLRNEEVEAGGSLGRQLTEAIFGRRKNRGADGS